MITGGLSEVGPLGDGHLIGVQLYYMIFVDCLMPTQEVMQQGAHKKGTPTTMGYQNLIVFINVVCQIYNKNSLLNISSDQKKMAKLVKTRNKVVMSVWSPKGCVVYCNYY